MPLEIVEGDLFDGIQTHNLDAIGHGVNCKGVMGAGIAFQFAKKFPHMEEAYNEVCENRWLGPGGLFVWEEPSLIVYNLASQYWPGSDAKLEWLNASLKKMLNDAEARSIKRIGIPRIGTGIGGLPTGAMEVCARAICLTTGINVYMYNYKGSM